MEIKRFYFLFLLLLSHVLCASSVWKLTSGESTLYIGGTVHMLKLTDYPLPEAYDTAYEASERVVFETDINKMMTPSVQMEIIQNVMYMDGTTVKDHMGEEAYAALQAFCEKKDYPLERLSSYKPGMLAISLALLELQKLGINPIYGVDQHFNQRARTDEKEAIGLVPVDEHIELIYTLSDALGDDLVIHTLEDLDRIGEIMPIIMKAWRSGDLEILEEQFLITLKKQMPELHDHLMTDRNKDWAPTIEGYIKSGVPTFVLVGTAHLVGKDSVIELLEKKGYTLEQMK